MFPGGLCPLLSVTRLSGFSLTRGFASPPHDGYAVIGKGPRDRESFCIAGATAGVGITARKVSPLQLRHSGN